MDKRCRHISCRAPAIHLLRVYNYGFPSPACPQGNRKAVVSQYDQYVNTKNEPADHHTWTPVEGKCLIVSKVNGVEN